MEQSLKITDGDTFDKETIEKYRESNYTAKVPLVGESIASLNRNRQSGPFPNDSLPLEHVKIATEDSQFDLAFDYTNHKYPDLLKENINLQCFL